MAPPRRIEEHVRRYLSDAAHLAGRADGYQIPDFFARKRIEEELRRARDDLERRVAQRTAELEQANERLREEMRVDHAFPGVCARRLRARAATLVTAQNSRRVSEVEQRTPRIDGLVAAPRLLPRGHEPHPSTREHQPTPGADARMQAITGER